MRGEKYLEFENYLKNSNKDYYEFTFEQIEGILGQKLAPSSYKHPACWYHPESHAFPLAWYNAGYKLDKLNLRERTVNFIKVNTAIEVINGVSSKPQKEKLKIDINYVISKGDEFLKKLNNENSRYLSWEHCYTAFADCNELTEPKIDFLCLHLAFYLASWGMYRGSSFLLQKDYLVHKEAVKEIYNPKYRALWGISCSGLEDDGNIDLIMKVSDRLKEIYVQKRKNFDNYEEVSDILITKILMGTFGCVPAYDRFFIETVRTYKIASGIYNKRSLSDLVVFYNDNRVELDAFKVRLLEQRSIQYPEMKILDMSFWYMAYEKAIDKE